MAVTENLATPGGSVTAYAVREDMERAGFTRVAVTLGLRLLQQKFLVQEFEDSDFNGNEFMAYRLTDKGWEWLLTNQHRLVLKHSAAVKKPKPEISDEDEVPF